MSLDVIIETGSYSGNGTTQAIAIGWQPALVMIASTRTTPPTKNRGLSTKTADMPGDDFFCCEVAGVWTTTNGITLTSTGFSVGSDTRINDSGVTFHWVAVRAGAGMDTGAYTGSGGNQTITTGREPSIVLDIQTSGGNTRQFCKVAAMASGDATVYEAAVASQSSVLTLLSTGFQAAGAADASSAQYYWAALYDIVGSTAHCETGSYTGNGGATPGQTITTGRQPRWLFIFGPSDWAFKSDQMAGDDYGHPYTQYDWETADGPALTSTGFTTGGDLNANGSSYYWLAGYV